MAAVVAFIGIGIMGGRMVRNVLKAGHPVRARPRTHDGSHPRSGGAVPHRQVPRHPDGVLGDGVDAGSRAHTGWNQRMAA